MRCVCVCVCVCGICGMGKQDGHIHTINDYLDITITAGTIIIILAQLAKLRTCK